MFKKNSGCSGAVGTFAHRLLSGVRGYACTNVGLLLSAAKEGRWRSTRMPMLFSLKRSAGSPILGGTNMKTLRLWIILSWTALPAAMFGGAFLLRRVLSLGEGQSYQATWLRAFHAHGTVLILMSLLYYTFLDHTSLSTAVKRLACGALFSFWPSLEDFFCMRYWGNRSA
jgi:hypothetical protein